MKQNTFDDKKDNMLKKHRKNKFWKKAVALLSCVTVFCTSYTMIMPAMTMSETTYCGQEEGENHTHTLQCYSNPDADLETEANWSATIPTLTGNWNEDVVAVANSQLGYHESTANYHVSDNNEKKGYTRYGAWMNDPYADWNTDFVLFCLHYANVDANALSLSNDISTWTSNGAFVSKDSYAPNAGDLIVLDENNDGAADHAAIITEANGNAIRIVEGDFSDAVTQANYDTTDARVIGYIWMPQNPAMQTAETAEETAAPVEISAPAETAQPEVTTAPETEQAVAAETATPEATAEPQETTEPEVTATPEATSTPEVTTTPEADTNSSVSSEMNEKNTRVNNTIKKSLFTRLFVRRNLAANSLQNLDIAVDSLYYSNDTGEVKNWADLSKFAGQQLSVDDNTHFMVKYKYHIDKGAMQNGSVFVYQIPENELKKLKNGQCSPISDQPIELEGNVAGSYSISSDGKITIKFNSKAIDLNKNSDADGVLNYEFALCDLKITNNKIIDLPYSDTITLPEMHFPADLTLQKWNNVDYNSHKVKYTINVNSKYGTYGNVTLDDKLETVGKTNINRLNISSIHVVKSDGKNGNSTSLSQSSSVSSDTYVINSSSENDYTMVLPQMQEDTKYTITYETSYDHDLSTDFLLNNNNKIANTVNAETPDEKGGTLKKETTSEFWLNSVNVTKHGNYDEKSKTVKWTITVNNPSQYDLAGVRLKDTYKNSNLTTDEIVDNAVTMNDGQNHTLSKDEFVNFTFPSNSSASNYSFTYTTSVTDADFGKTISNKATITPPHGNNPKDSGDGGNVNIPNQSTPEPTPTPTPTPTPDPSSPIYKEGKGTSKSKDSDDVLINKWHASLKLESSGNYTMTDEFDWNDNQYFTADQLHEIYRQISNQFSGSFTFQANPYNDASNLQNGINWQADAYPFDENKKYNRFNIVFEVNNGDSGNEINLDYESSYDLKNIKTDDNQITFKNTAALNKQSVTASNKYVPEIPAIKKYDNCSPYYQNPNADSHDYKTLDKGTLKWLIRVSLRDYSNGSLTVTENIPGDLNLNSIDVTGMYAQNGSNQGTPFYADVDLNKEKNSSFLTDGNGSMISEDLKIQTEVNGKQVKIIFPSALIQQMHDNISDSDNRYIDLAVNCQIPEDKDWSKLYQSGTYKAIQKYNNTAELTYGNNKTAEASHEITVSKDDSENVLNKVSNGIDYGSAGISNILSYTVHINQNADQLIESKIDHSTFSFTDTFCAQYDLNTNGALSFKLDNIKIVKVKGEGDISGIVQKTEGSISAPDSSTTRIFTGLIKLENIPDKTAIDVTYQYKISGERATTLTGVSNTAKLEGGNRVAEKTVHTGSLTIKKSSASVEFHGVTFVKVSSDDNAVKLPDAEFELSEYDSSIGAATDEQNFKKLYSVKTGEKGTFTLSDLVPNRYYRLVETRAPKSYQCDSTPFYFYVQSSDTTKYPLASINLGSAKIHIFSGGDQHYFENKPIYQVVHLKKVDSTDSSTVLPGAKFRIYSDPDCQKPVEDLGILTSDENGVIRDAKGNDSFTLLGGTYYLKETKEPAGYDRLKKVLVVHVDQNGVTVTAECRIRKNGTAVSLSRHAVSLQRNAQ